MKKKIKTTKLFVRLTAFVSPFTTVQEVTRTKSRQEEPQKERIPQYKNDENNNKDAAAEMIQRRRTMRLEQRQQRK